jgi:putative ABC transport system permease protein
MRDAARYWLNHRAQALWVVLAIGLAAGVAAAAVFVTRELVWKPRPFSDRVVVIRPTDAGGDRMQGFWANEYLAWRDRQRVFPFLGAYQFGFPTAGWVGDHAESFNTLWITSSFFDVLDVTPAVGRRFRPTDVPNGQDEVAILGTRAWKLWFQSDPSVIGRRIRLTTYGDPWSATIVGVMPEGVDVDGLSSFGTDLFLPLTDGTLPEAVLSRGWNTRDMVARLPDGLSADSAARLATDLVPQVAADAPARPPRAGVRLTPLADDLYGRNRSLALFLIVAAGFVVAVACANTSGLLLVSASLRNAEFLVRAALGASLGHLRRLAFAEGALLAVACAVLAAIVMPLAVALLVALAPSEIRGLPEVSLNWYQVVGSAGLGGVLAWMLNLIPLLVGRPSPHGQILLAANRVATAPRSAVKLRGLLLGTQVAVILALLVGAGLMISTLWHLTHQPLGFSADNVISAQIGLSREYISDTPRYQQLLRDLRSAAERAGSRQTAVSFEAPLASSAGGGSVGIVLPSGVRQRVQHNIVSEDFFAVLKIPFLAGRDFRTADYVGGHFVIVNRSFAEAYLGGVLKAVGQHISLGRNRELEEIVGVVGDVRDIELTKAMQPAVYAAFSAEIWKPSRIHLLARGTTAFVHSSVLSGAVRNVDPNLVVRDGRLSDRFREQTALTRMQTTLLTFLASFTLILAILGIYALVAKLTNDRMREFGIRSALGATQDRLVWLAMRAVMTPVTIGILTGLTASWALVHLVQQFLFGTQPFDPAVWSAAVVVLLAGVFAAAWLPARRAGLLNPAEVLRRD